MLLPSFRADELGSCFLLLIYCCDKHHGKNIVNFVNYDMHERKPQRLANYNYSRPGFYFVTITLDSKKYTFGDIIEGVMRLNALGNVVGKQWKWLFERYNYIEIDEYVIMPDHFHGIVHIIGDIVGNGRPDISGFRTIN